MSRSKFEAIYGAMGFDLTRYQCLAPEPWSEYADEKTGCAWAGWLAGRESMRSEAADVASNILCSTGYDFVSDRVWSLEP